MALSSSIIVDLGLLLIIAAVFSYFASKLRQPLILGYIAAGLLLGLFLPSLVADIEGIKILSRLGIAFLLFLVGLELSVKDIKHLARVSIIVGLGQIVFTFIFGYFLIKTLGYNTVESLYIAIALTFSSTIIVLKILGEKNEINSLYGKISIGVLLIQDFVALLILVGLGGFSPVNGGSYGDILLALLKGIIFIIAALLASRFLLSKLFNKIAKSQELLFLSSIALCFLFILISEQIGLSIEIGSFLAGLSLANLPFRLEIGNKIKPLRDFFIVLFFIMLGVQMGSNIAAIPIFAAILLSLFVLIGNPLIVLVIMGLLGYRKRTSFFTGLTVAQISEFSLVLVVVGNSIGHLSNQIVSFVTMIGIITITLSVYMMQYNNYLYGLLSRWLNVFERRKLTRYINERLSKDALTAKDGYVLFGCRRLGYNIASMLREMHKKLLVIDFNPVIVNRLNREGIKCIYGDLGDYELFDDLNLAKAEFVISTIPDKNGNSILVRRIKAINRRCMVVLTADNVEDALELYKLKADYVIVPYLLSSEKVADILRLAIRDRGYVGDVRNRHIDALKKLEWLGN